MSKPLRIVFCLPGRTFTQGFMKSWIQLLADDRMKALHKDVSMVYRSSVTHCRNEIVEKGNKKVTRKAKPFGGIDYDYAMWIDSDSVFTPDDFFKLLYANREIVTGFVPINVQGTAACGLINGYNPTKYIMMPGVSKDETKLIDIEFCGFAFLLIKHGVFESMEYPWFRLRSINVGKRVVTPSEDVEWCIRAGELGWKLYAHPQVRIGHEKTIIIQS